RASPVTHKNYFHFVQDVTEVKYRHLLAKILLHCPDLNVCIYCVGIGDQLDLDNLSFETKVLETNLMAAAVTTEIVLSDMIRRDTGHFIGLSSVADVFTSADAPSYSASKAGLSRYWEGLSLALKG